MARFSLCERRHSVSNPQVFQCARKYYFSRPDLSLQQIAPDKRSREYITGPKFLSELSNPTYVQQRTNYPSLVKTSIGLCPSRAEDEQHSKEAKQRERAAQRARHIGSDLSKCSALCSSTAVDAVSFQDIPGSSGSAVHSAARRHCHSSRCCVVPRHTELIRRRPTKT